MMRGGAAVVAAGATASCRNQAPMAAASATFICSKFLYGALCCHDLNWMRFFKPCAVDSNQQNLEPSKGPSEKEPSSTREGFVQTPSLQKEMKTRDMFNAKRKETEDRVEEEESAKERAGAGYGTAQQK